VLLTIELTASCKILLTQLVAIQLTKTSCVLLQLWISLSPPPQKPVNTHRGLLQSSSSVDTEVLNNVRINYEVLVGVRLDGRAFESL